MLYVAHAFVCCTCHMHMHMHMPCMHLCICVHVYVHVYVYVSVWQVSVTAQHCMHRYDMQLHMLCMRVRVACSWRSMDARMPVAGADSAAREKACIWSLATAVGEWLSEERTLTLTSRQTTAAVRVSWSASSSTPQSELSEPLSEPRLPWCDDSSRNGSLLSAGCRWRPDGSRPAASRSTVRCAWPRPRPIRPTTPPS
jgi:hypothetical protein